MKNVVCMKWGTRYGAEYVNRLYGMVRRNTSGDLRVVCMTDDARGVREEVECWACPEVDLPPPHRHRGWRKVSLFAETLGDLTGDVLFLDLDVVITGGLDEFFSFGDGFTIMANPTQRGQGIGNTSVYRFRVGERPDVLSTLLADPERHIRTHTNSQTYISRTLGELAYWPEAWCVSFKADCLPSWPRRVWHAPELPAGAKIVIFTGKPDPDDAAAGRWPAPVYKKWYKTFRAPAWINEHWKA